MPGMCPRREQRLRHCAESLRKRLWLRVAAPRFLHAPERKELGMYRILNLSRIVAVLAVTAALFTPGSAHAQRLGNDTIALFPKNVGEFAYANLKQARSQKWFPQLQEQMLPERFRQFERFLASAGIDPNSQVEEVAWGLVAEGVNAKTEGTGSSALPTGEEIVGVALG